jgi:Domain of unknown function (DUF4169)
MNDIVNLRQARKRKRRSEAEGKAADNRHSFGLSAKEKKARRLKHEFDARRHEGHRRTPDDD